uniref:Uncharacterized protein n=1 Tax=Tetranychus urticae TaxID=32264 RepID=T1KH86_TETUR
MNRHYIHMKKTPKQLMILILQSTLSQEKICSI